MPALLACLRSFTVKPPMEEVSTIGVVLYSRSFYVNKAISSHWPKSALLRGLQVILAALCIHITIYLCVWMFYLFFPAGMSWFVSEATCTPTTTQHGIPTKVNKKDGCTVPWGDDVLSACLHCTSRASKGTPWMWHMFMEDYIPNQCTQQLLS